MPETRTLTSNSWTWRGIIRELFKESVQYGIPQKKHAAMLAVIRRIQAAVEDDPHGTQIEIDFPEAAADSITRRFHLTEPRRKTDDTAVAEAAARLRAEETGG